MTTGRQITLEEADELAQQLWDMGKPRNVNVPQKPIVSIPMPGQRPPDWIKHEDEVAFVRRKGTGDKAKIIIGTGHICSWPGSHGNGMDVDNIKKTIVWSDEELRMADNADDAHEKSFETKDPCLLRLDEIIIIRDPERAVAWFNGVFTPETAREICALLNKPDFGYEERQKKEQEAREKLHSERKPRWWEKVEGG